MIDGEDSESGIVDIHDEVWLVNKHKKKFEACKAACEKRVTKACGETKHCRIKVISKEADIINTRVR